MSSEEKLTPKEAFEHLQAVFPSIVRIGIVGDTLRAFRNNACDFNFSVHIANIDWGDATEYKPERWRPATMNDIRRALNNPIKCRAPLTGRTGFTCGMLVGGYICSVGFLTFNVMLSNDAVEAFQGVEVLE